MKTEITFRKGQKVTVRKMQNASDFNNDGLPIYGVYSIDNWSDTVFTIEGTIKLIKFSHSDSVFCAYLLSYKGNPIGYVYNTGIIPHKEGCNIEFDANEAIEKLKCLGYKISKLRQEYEEI
jgi:hypothetical protein